MDEKDKHSALAFSYTLLGYLQAEHDIYKEYESNKFEDSFGYKLITKIIELIKGE